MPELTVSMPAYNSSKFIDEAIESVLRQEGVDFELIVVDDGSEDNTVELVRSFKDPRIRLITNKKNMGIAYCHNVVIDESKSPFITHVDSDDLVLPGAFQKMMDMIKSSPNLGQVHCNYYVIDENGRRIKDSSRKPDMDYKRELLVRGGVMNHLRTYRKELFDVAGKFDENLKYSIDTEMALRIIDKYDIKLVTESLYCRRLHKGNASQSLRFKELRFWFQRLLFSRRLLESKKILFPREKQYKLSRLMILGLYCALRFKTFRNLITILRQ